VAMVKKMPGSCNHIIGLKIKLNLIKIFSDHIPKKKVAFYPNLKKDYFNFGFPVGSGQPDYLFFLK